MEHHEPSGLIPLLIHQTWRDLNVPGDMARLARTWRDLNPHWHYKLWTDDENRELVEQCAPWFLPTYDGYPEEIMRVDAFRYFLMLHVGGVYVDLDFECLRPIDDLTRGALALVALEPQEHLGEDVVRRSGLDRVVGNAFLGSAAGHPFWQHVIAALGKAKGQRGPLEATGPFLLTRALASWQGAPAVSLMPSPAVYPLPKRGVWAGRLATAQGRESLRAAGAFAVHHWMGTWVRTGPGGDEHQLGSALPLRLVRCNESIRAAPLVRHQQRPAGAQPAFVSALMVTRDRAALAACSIDCFRRQTWPHRELVIVDDGQDDALPSLVRALGDPRIRLLRLSSQGLPLGTLRNRAVAEARGELVCQWDDDDLFHPERIALQVAALEHLEADACVLERETLWWPHLGRVAWSAPRLWESSLLARKAVLPAYRALRRGEDTPVMDALARDHSVAVLDEPRLQVYVIHGANTFPAAHFERFWQTATARHEGPAARAWQRAHDACLPLDRLAAALEPAPPRASVCREAELPPLPSTERPRVLILTPVKDAVPHLPRYLQAVLALDWPKDRLSLGLLESDSGDGTYERLCELRTTLQRRFDRVTIARRNFGFRPAVHRWARPIQRQRRSVLARSRNELLAQSLAPDHEWVLWIDVDVIGFAPDLIQRLIAARKQVVVPRVVSARTGDTYDLNTWRLHPAARALDWSAWLVDGMLQPPRGLGRQYLGELLQHRLVEVDAVGGCALLVRADLHRAGVVFPEQPLQGLIETEGLAVLARERGSACFGLPHLQVVHA
jgi:glycosyltransferase involved in cell wall biosynthesis